MSRSDVPSAGAGPGAGAGTVAFGSRAGRWILAATVGGSGMAFLDGTVINVALPTIGRELSASVAGLQWTLNGYLLTLSALILLSGSLGDRYGRLRIFLIGIVWFALASAACAVAPSIPILVAARVLQGVGGALLTPGSLAIIEATFRESDRPRAIGAWSGLTGVSTAIGPFLGGWLVDIGSWRYIFLLNLPLAAIVIAASLRHVPESRDPAAVRGLDVSGAVLIAAALGGITYALTEAGSRGFDTPIVIGAGAIGIVALIGFVAIERRTSHPMLPRGIFSSHQFTAANVVTAGVYAALGAVFFLLVVQLQTVLGYSALQAGLAALPITILMLALSARSGQLAQRIGPRAQMSIGPLVMAVGLVLMLRIGPGGSYVDTVLPAVVLLGLGLAITVAPLTSAALASVAEDHAGAASGVNNAVARTAQVAAIAVVPLAAGISGAAYRDPAVFATGFRVAMLITAGLAVIAGFVALVTIRNPLAARAEPPPAPPVERVPVPAARQATPAPRHHCSLDGTPLSTCPRSPAKVGGSMEG